MEKYAFKQNIIYHRGLGSFGNAVLERFLISEKFESFLLGTENIFNAAIEAGVKKVICLSTDKAAYPVNAMGTSKAMMEKVIVAKSRTVSPEKTTICCTRYGNVMCSRGSVIPLFIDQIKARRSLTVTEPKMTRFIMSLDKAVDWVLYAFENVEIGDIMVQKSPDLLNVEEVKEKLLTLKYIRDKIAAWENR